MNESTVTIPLSEYMKLQDKEHEVKMLKFELSVIKSKTRELITWKGFIKYKIKNEIRRINKKVRHIFS